MVLAVAFEPCVLSESAQVPPMNVNVSSAGLSPFSHSTLRHTVGSVTVTVTVAWSDPWRPSPTV